MQMSRQIFLSSQDLIAYLKKNKAQFHKVFGVTKIGVFGSFARGDQSPNSDIDMVVEFVPDKKDIHNFLKLKRYLEEKTARKVDLGFEHTLKPAIKDTIKEQIIYV